MTVRHHQRFVVCALTLIGLSWASVGRAATPVVINGDPIAPTITTTPGQGLCISSAKSADPASDFGASSTVTYNAVVNAFMEKHAQDRLTHVQRTVLDLSNNNNAGLQLSYGDFTNAMLGCGIGGCDFEWIDTATSFAARLRGFFNVTQSMVNQPLHFGFFNDDAVGVVLFDKQQTQYPVIVRPPQLGAATWRTTNTVTFTKPGLYPIEILYLEFVEHAALEMSLLLGAFVDFELPASQMGSTSLKTAGFQLAMASQFYLTETGEPPFPADPDKCQQCNRQFANLPGNGDCGQASGYYCNGAALCSPCTSSYFCGPSCSPCGQSTPHCVNMNAGFTCVECRDDGDCGGQHCKSDHTCGCLPGERFDGKLCVPCNTSDFCGTACIPCGKSEPYCAPDGAGSFRCRECRTTDDCPRGSVCNGGTCAQCSTRDSCGGASCNCCPGAMSCLSVEGKMVCAECAEDADCPAGRICDTVNRRCVTKLAECNTSDKCGSNCVACPNDRPHCIAGKACAACRDDLDCAAGKFCLSGACVACSQDRRCGARCASCSGDKPFCKSDGTAQNARCVACLKNEDCGTGGLCNTSEGTCMATCVMSCAAGLHCYGTECVQCFADTQCPCGFSCNLTAHTCSPACNSNDDCGSAEYCQKQTKKCEQGRVVDADDEPCFFCTSRVGGRGGQRVPVAYVALLFSLIGAALYRARRRRS